jgi:hypothetical protein
MSFGYCLGTMFQPFSQVGVFQEVLLPDSTFVSFPSIVDASQYCILSFFRNNVFLLQKQNNYHP